VIGYFSHPDGASAKKPDMSRGICGGEAHRIREDQRKVFMRGATQQRDG
jgi:hypothetical protein